MNVVLFVTWSVEKKRDIACNLLLNANKFVLSKCRCIVLTNYFFGFVFMLMKIEPPGDSTSFELISLL
jgi:hypothetical protein